ncbi:MAG: hypothetical protein CMC94_05495 [Flavobacteriales bacterium]|nr:hypothetical protein [Flavobacteriales bacterium]
MKTLNITSKKISIRIAPTEQDTYTVNGKEVYQNMNGNWVAKDIQLFSASELRAWSNYKALVIDGNRKNLIMTIYS